MEQWIKAAGVLVGMCIAVEAGALSGGGFRDSTSRTALFCDMAQIRSELSKDNARYVASGSCSWREGSAGTTQSKPGETGAASTFDDYNNSRVLYRFTWTAEGTYNPTTKVTVEAITAPAPRVDEATPTNRPYGLYRLEMICDHDPWLDNAVSTRCTQPRVSSAGNLPPEVQNALKFTGRPFTAHMAYAQRDALRSAQQQFDARQAALAKIGNQPVSSAGSTTRAGSAIGSIGNQPLSSAGSTTRAGSAIGSIGSATASVDSRTSTVQGTAAAAAPAPSTGGTGTGTVSAALKLQAALDAQRAQQAAQGGAASAPAPTTPPPGSTSAPATQPVASTSAPATQPVASTGTPATQPVASTGTAATASKSDLPPGALPSSGMAAAQLSQTAAMRITAPAPNSEIRQGQLRVQVTSSGSIATRNVDVEFARLSPTQGEAKAPAPTRVQWTVSQDQAAQGVVVPVASGPRSSGRWQMRVRPAGATTWSEPVAFAFVALSEPKGKAWDRQSGELERKGLNPQPLPPKEAKKANPFERQGLNPQPLPPRETTTATPAERRTLNPQPLPPRDLSAPSTTFQR